MKVGALRLAGVLVLAASLPLAAAEPKYDLLLRGGHVIDARNGIDAVRDVAIAGGKIAAVAARIDPADAFKTVDVSGLYVTPGLVDIHVHVFAGTGEKGSYAGLNIVGNGMRGGAYEQDLADMASAPAAEMARKHPGLIVGIKTAHYAGPEWTPVEHAVEAGTRADIPVMVDFGANRPERPLAELVTKKLRPGDIYTHMYSGLRGEQDPSGRVNPGLWEGRKRGVIFDVGHGGGSFAWRIAVPAVKEGFIPDSISTDLHVGSMNAGMKDMLNVMSKFLALGQPLLEVVRWSTWNPAREIKQEGLGHLSVGAGADVAVLRLEEGQFGFVDSFGARLRGHQRLVCELTLRDGKVVYDLNGIARPDWDTLPKDYKSTGDPRWDGIGR
jgi:dihydroorotase